MKYGKAMAKQEKDWEAESDARTLMEAEKIMGDEKRTKVAQEAAKRLHKEKESEAESLKKIALGKFTYSSMPNKKKEE